MKQGSRTIGWHHTSEEGTRLLVKKRQADVGGVVRAVQGLAVSRNRLLNGDKVRAAINGLIGG